MLSPRLTNCPECASIPNLLKEIDCKLAQYAHNLYNNITFMLNQTVPADKMIQLIAYKRILTYKNCNPDYVSCVPICKIASKVIILTDGYTSPPAQPYLTTSSTSSSTSTTTSTTTVVSTQWIIFASSNPYSACQQVDGENVTVYTSTPFLGNGVTLYIDAALTIPYISNSYTNNILSNGPTYYFLGDTGGAIIINSGSCVPFAPTTTTTTVAPGTSTSINIESAQSGLVTDTSNNVYVACTTTQTVKKITPAGLVTTFGTTSVGPSDLTVDSSGNVFVVTQTGSGPIIVDKITPAGVSTVFANIATGSSRNIAIDSSNNLYLTCSFSIGNGYVFKITPQGSVSTFATTGNHPQGMAFDSLGNLYVANSNHDNVLQITPSGTITLFGITGDSPAKIVIDSSNTLYVTNYTSSGSVTKITSSGTSTIAGITPPNPYGVAVDSLGNIYTANLIDNSITKINTSGVSTTFIYIPNAAFYDIIIVGGYMYATSFFTFNFTKIAI